jgi:hypothetical protein
MIAYLVAMMLIPASYINCEKQLSEVEIVKSLEVLYEKNILHISYDTLFIKIDNYEIQNKSLDTINIRGKNVFLNFKKQGIPYIIFEPQYLAPKENKAVNNFYIYGGGGCKYYGEIVFRCSKDHYVFEKCNYISEIE